MRKLLTTLSLAAFGFAGSLQADQQMVVVELYTSQGCSSCPPADEIFSELVKRDDVIGLGFHVDYWDYLGWKDKFAQPKFTKRQETYNAVLPSRYRLVTPQMVVHGIGQVAGGTGASPDRINDFIEEARGLQDSVELKLERVGNNLNISLDKKNTALGSAQIHLVRFIPAGTVDIKKGENRGRKINYTNVVSEWSAIAKWDGKTAVTISHGVTGEEPLAVIIQDAKQGRILAARKID